MLYMFTDNGLSANIYNLVLKSRLHQISLKYASNIKTGSAEQSLRTTLVLRSCSRRRRFVQLCILRNDNAFNNLVNRSQWACSKNSRWQPASSQPQEGRHDAGWYTKIGAHIWRLDTPKPQTLGSWHKEDYNTITSSSYKNNSNVSSSSGVAM